MRKLYLVSFVFWTGAEEFSDTRLLYITPDADDNQA